MSVITELQTNQKVCYCCGRKKTHVRKNGKPQWYANRPTKLYLCHKCYTRFYRETHVGYMREYRKLNYKKLKKQNELWRQKNIERLREYRKEYLPKYRDTHRQELRDYKNKWRQEAKIMLMEILGGVRCKKCGYDKNIWGLQIDHINGKGTRERRDKFNNSTEAMYWYYIKRPKLAIRKLQVLCALCNIEKRFMNGEVNQYSKKNRNRYK